MKHRSKHKFTALTLIFLVHVVASQFLDENGSGAAELQSDDDADNGPKPMSIEELIAQSYELNLEDNPFIEQVDDPEPTEPAPIKTAPPPKPTKKPGYWNAKAKAQAAKREKYLKMKQAAAAKTSTTTRIS